MINITSPGALISSFKSFIGGMVTDILPTELKPYMMPNCLNVLPDINIGTLETRTGSIIVGRTPSGLAAKFLYTFNRNDGYSVVLVSDGATLWSTIDFKTFTVVYPTGIQPPLTSSATISAVTIRDKVWLTNGVDSVMTFSNAGVLTVLDGTGTTPNVPKGRYIIFCQERPWIARTTVLPSAIYFAAIHNSTGDPIAPDNVDAWPAVNLLYADQDDGDNIYGLINYLGTPFIFKSKSVGVVTGSDEYSYGYQRVMSNIGTRFHQCLLERDGVLEFVGPDGFYESQGSPATTVRVSDLIKTKFENLIQPKVLEKAQVWDTNAEWVAGSFSNTKVGDGIIASADRVVLQDTTSTDTFEGAVGTVPALWVSILGNTLLKNNPEGVTKFGFYNITYSSTLARKGSTISAGSWQCEIRNTATVIIGPNPNHIYGEMRFMRISNGDYYGVRLRSEKDLNNSIFTYLDFVKYYNSVLTVLKTISVGAGAGPNIDATATVKVTRSYLGEFNLYLNGVLQWTGTDTDITASGSIEFSNQSNLQVECTYFDNLVTTVFPITGTNTWISAIYDVGAGANINFWETFGVTASLNGQDISYQIRAATTSGGVATATWHDILPYATIAETLTTPFVQVKAIFDSDDVKRTPELISIIINWETGGTPTQRMYSINFKNRNLLTAAEEGYTYNNIVWVKPTRVYKPEDMQAVFVPLDWKITSFCVLNDILYAGMSFNDVSGTDEGAILQLFIGRRDEVYNGTGLQVITAQTINSFFEIKDENFELPMNKKKLMEVAIDFTPSGAGDLSLQRSTDGKTLVSIADIDNTGLSRTVKLSAVRGVLGRTHRLRIGINAIDQYLKVHGIEMIATSVKIRE